MYDVEILEGREQRVRGQRTPDQKLVLPRPGQQSVPGVDAQLLADAVDHAAYLPLEIGRIVDDVEIWVAYPGGGGLVIELPGEF